MKIDELHELDDEIRDLQENYNRALNYIVALRIDKSNLLKAINDSNKLEIAKDLYIAKDFDKQLRILNDPRFIIDEISCYSTTWNGKSAFRNRT